MKTSDILICGAGITGISAAYHLSKLGAGRVVLVDERPPLTLTSAYSTECYRNWWPDPAMLALMNRSIALMDALADESDNAFSLNRRGYLFLTANEASLPGLHDEARRVAALGAGDLRVHDHVSAAYEPATPDGYHDAPDGADLLLDADLIRRHYPGVTPQVKGALHARRAGWLSAQQLGTHLLARARDRGAQVLRGRIAGLGIQGNRLTDVQLDTGERIACGTVVNAAGPFLQAVARMAGLDLPVHTELHLKAALNDPRGVVDRGAPLLIWQDPQTLPWNPTERESLAADIETRWLTELFPSGVHTRPEGGPESQTILLLWEYRSHPTEPRFPPPIDTAFPEIAVRGLSRMLPRMGEYLERIPQPVVDGGYYTRTPENRPIIGPMPIDGLYVIGAVSGFGIMSACAAGELLAAHVTGGGLPTYAPAFSLARYDEPGYLQGALAATQNGQL